METNNYLNNLFNIENKTVLITGAAGQLGQVLVDAYLNAGAKVVATDLNLDVYASRESDNLICEHMNIAEIESVEAAFDKIFERLGKVDVLVNNAGVSVFEPFEERPEESFDFVMDVNLKGTFNCIKTFTNCVKDKNIKANIVNVASFYGVISPDPRIYTDCARKNSEVYGATKAGVIQMTKYFAVHLAPYNVRINSISPGGIFNPKSPQGEDFIKNYSFRCPMGRMANAEEMIGAVLYLSCDASSYTNGQNIVIDGGSSCW